MQWQTNLTPEVRDMELKPVCIAHSSEIAAQIVEEHNQLAEYRKALEYIAFIWPDPGMCGPLVPEYVGPNDGRIRADTLWFVLNKARQALGKPEYPRPKHWDMKRVINGQPEE